MSHLCPTSITCESLFSAAKHIITADKCRIDPSMLEMLLILKCNKDLCFLVTDMCIKSASVVELDTSFLNVQIFVFLKLK